MNKRNLILLICLLSLSTALGCSQVETSQPTATPIPGWEKFEGDGVELWLPESYKGGNLGEFREVAVEMLRKAGPDFEQAVEAYEQNPDKFMLNLWVYDTEIGDLGIPTNVMVIEEILELSPLMNDSNSSLTITSYLDAALKQLPAQFQTVERSIVSLGEIQAGRVVQEFTTDDLPGKQIQLSYLVKDGNTLWIINFATPSEEFDQRLPIFEQSMLTFAIQP